MPTSNGLVTSRDIRQASIKTLHILDEAVTTPKIPDLAITFPDKIDNPIWVTAFEGLPSFTIPAGTDVWEEILTTTIDVPAWVDAVSVLAIGSTNVSNTSGTVFYADLAVKVEGSFDGLARVHVPAVSGLSGRSALVHVENSNIIGVAGSSFVVSVDMRVGATPAAVSSGLWGIAVGQR